MYQIFLTISTKLKKITVCTYLLHTVYQAESKQYLSTDQILTMPDLTDQWIREMTPDPRYNPLPPSVEELEQYADDLDYEGNQITIEWATREMRSHQMGWVRLGLVADRVKRYRLYRGSFPDWNSFCKAVLGKENWQINKTINCAKAAIALVKEGFTVLPTCQSQAEKLLQCCKKSGQLLVAAWESVIEQLPEKSMITANRIGEALGFPTEYEPKLPKQYREQIKAIAQRDGMTVEEKLEEWIHMDTEPDEPESDEPDEVKKEQLWHRDLKNLIESHDHEIWLMTAISKLTNFSKRKTSQFAWLRSMRYQV